MNLYEIGPIYIWQNQVGYCAHLNGVECVVVAPVKAWGRLKIVAQETDTPIRCPDGRMSVMLAEAGDLRRKELPDGEKLVADQIKKWCEKDLETA